jgi:hypothetical protein
MSRTPGRRRAAIAYLLTSAALVAAVATGSASMLAGTSTPAPHVVQAPVCWPKSNCGDDCCVLV